MGELKMLRRPPRRDRLAVQLAHTEKCLGQLAIDLVAVDVEVGELVELAAGLQLFKRAEDEVWVPETDVQQGLRRGVNRRSVKIFLIVKGLGLHLVQTIGSSGALNVASDIGRLFGEFIGKYAEPLDDGGIDLPDHHRHKEPQGHGDDGQYPAAATDIDDQQHCGGKRDQNQQAVRR